MKLMCCNGCQFHNARARRTLYGSGAWCAHPESQDGVPQGVMRPESATLACAYGVVHDEAAPEREDRVPVVRVRRRIPATALS